MLDINTLWSRHLNILVKKGNTKKKKRREISKEKTYYNASVKT